MTGECELEKIKKQIINDKSDKITTNPQKQPGYYFMIWIGIMFFLIFFMCLFIIFYGRFDPILLLLSIIFLILGILVFIKTQKRYNQISIDKNGVCLIKGKHKLFIAFGEIENLAPLIKIDRSWYNFSKYAGITIRKKGENDNFVVVDPDEVDTVYYYYLHNAPNALAKERKRIPKELNKLRVLIQNSNIIKNCIIASSFLLSMILAVILLPDYNLWGENISWQMKMEVGFLIGLIVVSGIIIYFGYLFGSEFDVKIIAFKWRVSNLNNLLEQNNQDLFYVDKSSMDPIEKVVTASLRNAGVLLITFGLIILLIAINSITSSGMPSNMIFPILGGPIIFSLGFAFLRKSRSSPIK